MRIFSETVTCKARYWSLEDRLAHLCKRAYRLQREETTLSSLKVLVGLMTQHEGFKNIPWDESVIEMTVLSAGMVVFSIFPIHCHGNTAAMQANHITVMGYHYYGSKNPVTNLISAYDYGNSANVTESEAPGLLAAVIKRYCEACRGDTESPA